MKNIKGISLIVLIITIIVIIILAGATILSLTNSDILGNTKKAVFLQNAKSYQDELGTSLADEDLAEEIDSSTAPITGSSLQKYIPSMKEEDIDKYMIFNSELNANNSISITQREWLETISINKFEVFEVAHEYQKLYINPNPIKKPDDLPGVVVDSNFSFIPALGAFETGETEILTIMPFKKGANWDPEGMDDIAIQGILLMVPERENGAYMYIWEDTFSFEGMTLLKGWNKVIIDPVTEEASIAPATSTDLEYLSPSTLGNSGDGFEKNLGYYISTTPYTE